jgi:hypothetical protein
VPTKLLCACGCKEEFPSNRMTIVAVERASDPLMRQTKRKSFMVFREHKEPFELELALMTQLAILVRASVTMSWLARLRHGRSLIRIQQAIYERNEGFAAARRRALQSAVLFCAPKFLHLPILAHYERKAARHAARA